MPAKDKFHDVVKAVPLNTYNIFFIKTFIAIVVGFHPPYIRKLTDYQKIGFKTPSL